MAKNQNDIKEVNAGIKIVGYAPDVSGIPGSLQDGDAFIVGETDDWELYQKIDGELVDIGPYPPRGPQGIPGPQGAAAEIGVVNTFTETVDPLLDAQVTVEKSGKNLNFYFSIPRGAKGNIGNQGPQGIQGIQGIQGPQGAQGPQAVAMHILYTVATSADLPVPSSLAEPLGSAILVGSAAPYTLYVVTQTSAVDPTLMWKNLGPMEDNQVVVDAVFDISSHNAIENAPVAQFKADYDQFKQDVEDTFYGFTLGTDNIATIFAYCWGNSSDKAQYDAEIETLQNEIASLKSIVFQTVAASADYLIQSAYINAIPTYIVEGGVSYPVIDDCLAALVDLHGTSVVFNQLIQNGDFASTSGWVNYDSNFSVSGNVGTMTALVSYGEVSQTVQVTAGNKHYFYGWIKLTTAGTYLRIDPAGGAAIYSTATTAWQHVSGFFNASSSLLTIADERAGSFDAIQLKDFMMFDLTKEFGAGNEPTSESDIRILLMIAEYRSKNSGELKSTQPTKLISRGVNQWDEEWEVGSYDTSTGAKIPGATTIRSKNFIKVSPNATYYQNQNNVLFFYDANKEFISFTVSNKTTFTTPINCGYMTFRLSSDYGTVYKGDICINVSNAAINGNYYPFAKHEYDLTLPVMRSARSVADDKDLVRIGTYTFTGNEQWIRSGSSSAYYSYIAQVSTKIKANAANKVANIVCEVLQAVTGNALYTGSAASGIAVTNNNLWISINDYNEISKLTGKTINYELATPIDQSGVSIPETIHIYKGGTIELVDEASGYGALASVSLDVAVIDFVE